MSNPLRKRPTDDDPAEQLIWAGKIEKVLELPPLDFRGYRGTVQQKQEVVINRAKLMCEFINLFDKPLRIPAAEALAGLSGEKWMVRAKDWRTAADLDNLVFILSVLEKALKSDKAFWLLVAGETRCAIWEEYFLHLEPTASAHSFTREELVPLVASEDPKLRMLGLKLMASTLPDAKKASLRVSGR